MNCSRNEYEAIIKELVEQLTRKKPAKKILTLMCGGKTGIDVVTEQLRILQDNGYMMNYIFTEKGSQMFGREWIEREELRAACASDKASGMQLLLEADAVLIPMLTANTAAKIAAGFADDDVSTLIMHAILSDKPVIAAENGCNPRLFSTTSPNCNAAYLRLFDANIKKLKEYGICMIPAAQMYSAVNRFFELRELKYDRFDDDCFCGKAVSAGDVIRCKSRVMKIHEDALVTPAAKEIAEKNGVEFRRV